MQQLHYGDTSAIEFDVPTESLVADYTAVRGRALDDPAAAVAAALTDPLGFPPLARAVVPGDRVAIALDHRVPQSSAIVAGVVHSLVDAQVDRSDILILQSPANDASPPPHAGACAAAGLGDVQRMIHDPSDRAQLAYLAASDQAEPIYLNRHLCEADLVLPVGMLTGTGSLGHVGIHSGLFPAFSDEKSIRRFRSPASAMKPEQRQRRKSEVEEVVWLLGAQLTIQVVPGEGDSVLHVLAGDVQQVARRGADLVNAAWSFDASRKVELVVASIEGARVDQSWENFARALFAASQVCAEQGTIVLCTELQCPPGRSLRRLAGHEHDSQLARRIHRDRSADAVSASLVLESRDRHHVYLLSRLAEEDIESLGLGYVSDPAQINRLGRNCKSCILLGNAHRAIPRHESRSP